MMDPTNEVGHKMRSAIKAKLNELGCYVDDELPDYVMVMVANKRSRTQMEDDLQLFLGSNTEVFVDWLHQVLQKLQEVKIPPLGAITPIASTAGSKRTAESDVPVKKEKKEKKHKEKKSKREESSNKASTKLIEKRSDFHLEFSDIDIDMAEPSTSSSITDVFANKILQNVKKNTQISEGKNKVEETEITSTSEPRRKLLNRDKIISKVDMDTGANSDTFDIPTIAEIELQLPRKIVKRGRKELTELNEIEQKIEFAKKELANLNPEDSDEDVININENDELLDIDDQRNLFTKNLISDKINKMSLTPPPKKSLSERLGEKPIEKNNLVPQSRVVKTVESNIERSTIRSRLGNRNNKSSPVLKREAIQNIANRISSQIVAVPPKRSESPAELDTFAVSSVIKVKPRPLVPANQQANKNLLLKAVADAQKSIAAAVVRPERVRPAELFTKKYRDSNKEMKIGVTLPIRRANMRITVKSSSVRDISNGNGNANANNVNEYVPEPVTTDSSEAEEYIPSSIETELTKSKDSDVEDQFEITKIANDLISQNGESETHSEAPQFVVTLHGLDSSMFPSRKRKLETPKAASPHKESKEEKTSANNIRNSDDDDKPPVIKRKHTPIVYDKMDDDNDKKKINVNEVSSSKSSETIKSKVESRTKEQQQENNEVECAKPPEKTIKLKEVHKYDNLPATLSSEISKPKIRERCRFFPSCRLGEACEFSHPSSKLILCKTFPNCKFGSSCLYLHPQCKYDPDCTKRDCPFSHSATNVATTNMVVASHVVPVQSYKTISNAPLPTMCRYYPQCSNPQCTFYHPKPCRFGKYCHNKVECNFYHHDLPSKDKLTWKPSNFQPI